MSVKIYKITSTAGPKVYIGSTKRRLEERWWEHKTSSSGKRTTNSYILFDEYGMDTCSIELLEDVKEDEREQRERYWIDFHLTTVNKYHPGRTYKEYYDDNKEKMREKNKGYRDSHKDYFERKNREYRTENKDALIELKKNWASKIVSCEFCLKTMRRGSLTTHIKTQHLDKVSSSNQ